MSLHDVGNQTHRHLAIFSCREEAISQTGNPTNKSSMEMENHVFQKAKTRVRLQSKVIN